MSQNIFWYLGYRDTPLFPRLLFRSGGWVGGEMKTKANQRQIEVEVEAELGNNQS